MISDSAARLCTPRPFVVPVGVMGKEKGRLYLTANKARAKLSFAPHAARGDYTVECNHFFSKITYSVSL